MAGEATLLGVAGSAGGGRLTRGRAVRAEERRIPVRRRRAQGDRDGLASGVGGQRLNRGSFRCVHVALETELPGVAGGAALGNRSERQSRPRRAPRHSQSPALGGRLGPERPRCRHEPAASRTPAAGDRWRRPCPVPRDARSGCHDSRDTGRPPAVGPPSTTLPPLDDSRRSSGAWPSGLWRPDG